LVLSEIISVNDHWLFLFHYLKTGVFLCKFPPFIFLDYLEIGEMLQMLKYDLIGLYSWSYRIYWHGVVSNVFCINIILFIIESKEGWCFFLNKWMLLKQDWLFVIVDVMLFLFNSILRVKMLKSFLELYVTDTTMRLYVVGIFRCFYTGLYLNNHHTSVLRNMSGFRSPFYTIISDKCWYSKKLDILRRHKINQDCIKINNTRNYNCTMLLCT